MAAPKHIDLVAIPVVFNSAANGERAQIVNGHVAQRATKTADRCAHSANRNDVVTLRHALDLTKIEMKDAFSDRIRTDTLLFFKVNLTGPLN
jgi:hypothetical protein